MIVLNLVVVLFKYELFGNIDINSRLGYKKPGHVQFPYQANGTSERKTFAYENIPHLMLNIFVRNFFSLRRTVRPLKKKEKYGKSGLLGPTQ